VTELPARPRRRAIARIYDVAVSPSSPPLDAAPRAPLTTKLEGFGTTIFGEMSVLSRIVYVLVGLSALYQIVPLIKAGDQRA